MKIDLTKIPDHELNREYWRRVRARRDTANLGRKKIMAPCKFCHQEFSVMDMRKHVPICRREHQQKTGPEGPASGGVYQAPGAALRSSPHHGAEPKSSTATGKTLAQVDIGRTPVRVRCWANGITGWAVRYGSEGFGGMRISVCRTRRDARDLDVSNDTNNPAVIDRHVNRSTVALNDWEVL